MGRGGATEGRTPRCVKYGFGEWMGAVRWAARPSRVGGELIASSAPPAPPSPRGMVAGSRAVASSAEMRRAGSFAVGGGATVKTALGWPVFPSGTRMKIYFLARGGVGVCRDRPLVARVVELVDTQVSEACAVRCSGSSPLSGTISELIRALKWSRFMQISGWSDGCQCQYGARIACYASCTE